MFLDGENYLLRCLDRILVNNRASGRVFWCVTNENNEKVPECVNKTTHLAHRVATVHDHDLVHPIRHCRYRPTGSESSHDARVTSWQTGNTVDQRQSVALAIVWEGAGVVGSVDVLIYIGSGERRSWMSQLLEQPSRKRVGARHFIPIDTVISACDVTIYLVVLWVAIFIRFPWRILLA